MPNLVDNPETPKSDDQKIKQAAVQQRLDHSAEDAAEQAEKTEQRYDQGQDIFTK